MCGGLGKRIFSHECSIGIDGEKSNESSEICNSVHFTFSFQVLETFVYFPSRRHIQTLRSKIPCSAPFHLSSHHPTVGLEVPRKGGCDWSQTR